MASAGSLWISKPHDGLLRLKNVSADPHESGYGGTTYLVFLQTKFGSALGFNFLTQQSSSGLIKYKSDSSS